MHIEANVEARNRTAPFPFCGNRFEFRAVGSSQNCCLPIMVCNAVMSAGMAHLAGPTGGCWVARKTIGFQDVQDVQCQYTNFAICYYIIIIYSYNFISIKCITNVFFAGIIIVITIVGDFWGGSMYYNVQEST
jgi:uncharacterized Tic20 family protein